MKAFTEAQNISALRSSLGNNWPLFEFWSDKVAPLRKIMDTFMEPLLEEALTKRKLENGADVKKDNDGSGTLLAHLVKHTQGK